VISNNELLFYSILHPFGNKLNLNDFTAKITLKEYSSQGSYRVVYLVNKEGITSFKIMELFYKNFDEINNALPFKVIKFSPTTLQYFKLLFFGGVLIKVGNNKKTKSSNHFNYVRIFVILGISLFVLTLIIKWVTIVIDSI
jgi:PKD repeat protein